MDTQHLIAAVIGLILVIVGLYVSLSYYFDDKV